jgi:hypothetical protein
MISLQEQLESMEYGMTSREPIINGRQTVKRLVLYGQFSRDR